MKRITQSTPVIWAVTLMLVLLLAGCIGPRKPPERPDNICEIFRENRDWYQDAYDSYERWRVPIPVMMAIMHQESRFNAKIKPPRTTCLWIFPGPRPSSAYGYSQALDSTWDKYRGSSGNSGADRDEFGDAVDFIGWYCYMSHVKCKIARNDAYKLYLAYHEGHGGYLRNSYNSKPWLRRVAQKVTQRARTYQSQLASCEREFTRRKCCLWPF